jgi:2-deoxy-D-gluconate 3-dehydrogenase
MQDLFSLEGKVSIVTGGNGGIGRAIVHGLAQLGSSIVIAARNQAKTVEAAREIKDEFRTRVLGVKVDVKQEEEIQAMVQRALDEFGRIDILVNNAGMNIRKLPQELLGAEWDEVLNVNLRSAFLCSKAVYPPMKKAGGGKIINIGSMLSILGMSKAPAYGASKGGIVQLTRSLAVAWAPDNIQVNAVLPGYINTDLTKKLKLDVPGLNERVQARTPAARWGEPEDIKGAAIFLASRASDFVTGVALPVDGGFSISV